MQYPVNICKNSIKKNLLGVLNMLNSGKKNSHRAVISHFRITL